MRNERKQKISKACIINANSYENGIIFMPNIFGVNVGISVIETEQGEIDEKHYINATYNDIIQDNKEIKKLYLKIPEACMILFYEIIMLLGCWRMNEMKLFPAIAVFIYAIPELCIVKELIVGMKINGKMKQLGKYHSAEHKAINAFRKLGRAPKDITELNKYSRFSKHCGVKLKIMPAVPKIIFCIAWISTENIINTLVITIACSIIIIYIIYKGVFRFLQVLVTETPTEKELDLALKGIQAVEFVVNSARIDEMDGKKVPYINYPNES